LSLTDILHQLFLGTSQDQGIATLLESLVNQILQAQITKQLAVEPSERTEERQDNQNCSYPHQLTTQVEGLTLHVQGSRNGKFSTELFDHYQRSEQAFVLALMEMVVNGTSTRKVAQVTEELCGSEFSKSTVSDLCKRLDPLVESWNNRSLRDIHYPFVIVDALVLKIREDGRIQSRGIMIAVGVNTDGYCEALGLMPGDAESESCWNEFFTWLKGRGLSGVDLIVADGHGGLIQAVRRSFQGVLWQRCQTHFIRNIMDATPKSLQEEIYTRIRTILDAADPQTSRLLLNQTVTMYDTKTSNAIAILKAGFDDATAIWELPKKYLRRLRTTDIIELLNKEFRRRERVIRIFPNQTSTIRMIGALLMEFNDQWAGGKKYLDMPEYLEWKKTHHFV
jgi:putative transposase